MANVGELILRIKSVENQPAVDTHARIDVRRKDNTAILRFKDLSLPLAVRLEIPAFPQESNLFCDVMPKRYRPFFSPFFTLSTAGPLTLEARALRLPKQWSVRFTQWNQLSADFTALKTVLDESKVKVIKGETLGRFTDSKYDSVDGAKLGKTALAKTALLNIFAKLTVLHEPIHGQKPWFSFVEQIRVIDCERFYALVDVQMVEIVQYIKDHLDIFDTYESATAGNHFQRMQEALPDFRVFKSNMLSIKTDERNGNLQLTLAPAKDPDGNDVLLLDADIDENGGLLEHLIDTFLIHPFSGGTHPFDIHEYLVMAHPTRELGYELI